MDTTIKKELQSIVGSDRVNDSNAACWAYAFNDFGSVFNPPFVGGKPDIVVKPSTTEEVSKIVKLAAETETHIVPAGGREGNASGAVPTKGGILLDLTLMDSVITICKKSRAVRAQAGITYTKLRDRVRKEGYWLGNQGPGGPLQAGSLPRAPGSRLGRGRRMKKARRGVPRVPRRGFEPLLPG